MGKELNKKTGLLGETKAGEYLKKNKYKILEKNYKNKVGEIDIIAMKKNLIVFFEVKARSSLMFGRPSEAVNEAKQRKIRAVASLYLVQRKLTDKPCRFDVIEILNDEEINHIENAF